MRNLVRRWKCRGKSATLGYTQRGQVRVGELLVGDAEIVITLGMANESDNSLAHCTFLGLLYQC